MENYEFYKKIQVKANMAQTTIIRADATFKAARLIKFIIIFFTMFANMLPEILKTIWASYKVHQKLHLSNDWNTNNNISEAEFF